MVEATGESIYHTALATKCGILPRHLLSIIMASFAQHWVLVPTIHANQISREKNVLENEKTLGTRVTAHRPQGTPSYENRFRADTGGKGKSQTGGEKRVRRKGKKREKSPFFMFLRTIFFFACLRLSLAPTICPWVSEDGPRCGRFLLCDKIFGKKTRLQYKRNFPGVYLSVYLLKLDSRFSWCYRRMENQVNANVAEFCCIICVFFMAP